MNNRQLQSPISPLYSNEAEQSVLGGLMLENDRWDDIVPILSVNDFSSSTHRLLFTEMARLISAGHPIDLITLTDSLEKQSRLEQVGGFAYVAELSKNTPSAANIEAYSQIVADYSRARQLVALGSDISREAAEPRADIAEVTERAEQRLFAIAEKSQEGQPVNLIEGLEHLMTQLEIHNGSLDGITGTPTGYTELDMKTCGLQDGDLILLAGRPSMGKTALALGFAQGALNAKEQKPVQIFSLEMSADQLLMRFVSMLGSVPLQNLRSGQMDDEDWAKVSAATGIMIQEWQDRLIIDDTGSLTPSVLRSRARRNVRKYGQPGLILVDYLQLMRCPGQENRTQEIAEISRSLKALAKELHCPVAALSQLNRSLESRADKRPNNGDLRDSGALEQDADVTMFIYRDEVYNENTQDQGIAEIILGKQRQGPIGTVRLRFNARFTRFENIPADAGTSGRVYP